MGLPMAMQFSITAIGSVVIQSAVNTLGSDVVAAVTAAIKNFCYVDSAIRNFRVNNGNVWRSEFRCK